MNGRYFRSPYFFKAILKAYEKLIPDACSPSYFLYLTIDPSRIDVNVHPQKTEVKFADEEAVWQIIKLPCGKLSPRRERCRSWISIRRTASRFRC